LNEITATARGPSLEEQQEDTVVAEPMEEPEIVPTDEEQAYALDLAGRRFHSAGMLDSAYVYFSRAINRDPDVPEYHRNLGLTLWAMGDAQAAVREFGRTIQLDPASAPAYVNRAEAQLALGDTVNAMVSLEGYLARETNATQR